MARPLPFWPSEASNQKPLHPAVLHEAKKCRSCGKGFLFWHQRERGWRLHHYADLDDGQGPRFIVHRCGFDSAGKPLPTQPHSGGEVCP